jgi:hypothetical protein
MYSFRLICLTLAKHVSLVFKLEGFVLACNFLNLSLGAILVESDVHNFT